VVVIKRFIDREFEMRALEKEYAKEAGNAGAGTWGFDFAIV